MLETLFDLLLSLCCCWVAKSCLTLCSPMDCSTPGLPVPHHLPKFTQVHVHWMRDAINHLILDHPLLLLPSVFPSIRVLQSYIMACLKGPRLSPWLLMHLQAKEGQGLLATTESQEGGVGQFLHQSFQEELTQLTPWFCDSDKFLSF